MDTAAVLFLLALFAIGAARPHWGVSIVASLMPLATVLPGDLAVGSRILASPVAVVSAAAAAGASVRLVRDGRLSPNLVLGDRVRLLSLLFIAWLFFTHPTAAWFGEGDRNWVATFVQLWILMVIAGAALDTPEKQRLLMAAFGAACLLSAHMAILRGAIGESREVRVAGLAMGVNAASRYFAIGIVFWLFLTTQARRRWVKVLGLLAAAYLMLGVLFTQSRSGVVLAVTGVVLLPLVARRKRLAALATSLAALALLWAAFVPDGTVGVVSRWFTPDGVTATAGLDSVGNNIRYYLWEAGVQLWRENPIAGIGIGEFSHEVLSNMRVVMRSPATVMSAHNMFIRLLSETGVVGLVLFCWIVLVCLRRVWSAHATSEPASGSTAAAWLAVMVVLLVGAVFKDDTVEKLLWLVLGVASSFGLLPPQVVPSARRAVSPVLVTARLRRRLSVPMRRGGRRAGVIAPPRSS